MNYTYVIILAHLTSIVFFVHGTTGGGPFERTNIGI